jgi:hypothetical protein
MTGYRRNQKHYGIFACVHCRELQYCSLKQKTRQCVKCSTTLPLSEINFITRTNNIQEAIAVLQELKKRIGQQKGWGQLISADKLLKKTRKIKP